MPATIVVGTQWGDEGKGKLTDLLAKEMSLVVRYQGGHNAGHTIVVGDESFALQLLPSGVLYDHIVPVIRPEILSLGPVSEVLNEVSASLSTEDLRRMNGEVVAGTPVATVAGAWLARADAPSTPV